MKTLRLEIELTYDNDMMHGDDDEGWQWFLQDILFGRGNLLLHCNEIGDFVGDVKVLEVKP